MNNPIQSNFIYIAHFKNARLPKCCTIAKITIKSTYKANTRTYRAHTRHIQTNFIRHMQSKYKTQTNHTESKAREKRWDFKRDLNVSMVGDNFTWGGRSGVQGY